MPVTLSSTLDSPLTAQCELESPLTAQRELKLPLDPEYFQSDSGQKGQEVRLLTMFDWINKTNSF